MNAEQLRLNAQVEDEHWWFVGRRRIMQALVERIVRPDPETIVIDVGCGTGANIGSLAQSYHAVGIDTSPEAIELARQRFPGVQFIRGRAPDDLGALAGRARMFLLMDVLEHVEDDFEFFSQLVAAAAPETYFLVTVPANPMLWSEHDESHLHYRRYDAQRFRRLWDGLAVEPRLVSYFNARLYRPVQAIRFVNRLRGKASGEAGTDLFLPARPVNRLLAQLFAGEATRLVGLLEGTSRGGFAAGVSLLAVLRRGVGPCPVRTKPVDVAPDLFDPALRRVESNPA